VIISQGDTSPSQETFVCIRETKPNFQPDPGGQSVSSSPACPHAAFLFSSLQIKSFQPLLLKSASAFNLRVDQEPQHQKIPACHLYISIVVQVLKCLLSKLEGPEFKPQNCQKKRIENNHYLLNRKILQKILFSGILFLHIFSFWSLGKHLEDEAIKC
jgi:hypothetical protein